MYYILYILFKYPTELSRVNKNWIHSQLNGFSIYQESWASLEGRLSVLPPPKRESVPSGGKTYPTLPAVLYSGNSTWDDLTPPLPILRLYYSFGKVPVTDIQDPILQMMKAWLWEVRPGRSLRGRARRRQEGDQKPDCPSQMLRFL